MKQENIKVFVVLGRLGKNLSISKLAPVYLNEKVKKVYAFRESIGLPGNDKLQYITIPSVILKIKPAVLRRIVRWFFEPLQLFFYAIVSRPDVINGIYTLPKGLNSFVVSKILRIPCIISVIGGKEEIETEFKNPGLWKKLNFFMLKHTEAITCKGDRDIKYMVTGGLRKEKIAVLNGGIDIYRFNFEQETTRPFDIIFAGRFDPNKGAYRVLEMIKLLIPEFPDIKVVFLGDGELWEGFSKHIQKSALKNQVSILGFVNDPENYFRQSKIFVLPSTNEGLSTAMLEAMSCGCVPVVSDVGNMREAVVSDENGYIVSNNDDIGTFTMHIKELLLDNKKRNVLSSHARTTIEKRYSFKTQAVIFGEIIKSIQ